MKLTSSFRHISGCLLILCSYANSIACGPDAPSIPTPDFFGLSGPYKSMAYYEKMENLKLWQAMTSMDIPLSDIEEAVYHDSKARFDNCTYNDRYKTKNRFYNYLINTGSYYMIDLLSTAKDLEERRRKESSPWYYPENRFTNNYESDYIDIIETCRQYDGDLLKDRYALQITRALFASRQYAECIEFVDSAFSDFPDTNLMKRMAQSYMAGCWSILGQTQLADSVFAKSGDVWSISDDNRIDYITKLNPDAQQLIDYIRSNAADTAFMYRMDSVADKLIGENKVANKGDWYFLMAFVSNEYRHDVTLAGRQIYNAMKHKFSSEEFRDLARAYKMKIDAGSGSLNTLLVDLKWIEGKADILNADRYEWIRRIRNIIYADWIPELWQKKDYSTAIMLCSYADNIEDFKSLIQVYCGNTYLTLTVPELRDSDKYWNTIDYASLSFQLMGMLSSTQLATVHNQLMSSTPLYNFLRPKIRTDRDYYYELIGTLALREENYPRAEYYLSKVSDKYIKSMNIAKDKYLWRDPFEIYPTEWFDGKSAYLDGNKMKSVNEPDCKINAKLSFARKMQSFKRIMQQGKTPDERGIARLMYAIGRYNSFNHCWALTKYWVGWVGLFDPEEYLYYDWGEYQGKYRFYYQYYLNDNTDLIYAIYKYEEQSSLAMLTTDEARAEANYILGNLVTIKNRYTNTPVANYIRSSCDQWKNWY